MNNFPKITVLIPVFNSEKYLESALESIRNQTFTDFECLIINDGSTDNSSNLINSFIKIDNRFRVINKINSGVGDSLRIGLLEARGEYIARMDADDFSYPNRLHAQFEYMKKYDDVDVCGSLAAYVDENGTKIKTLNRVFQPNRLILTRILLGRVPFAHPTVFFRKNKILKLGNYRMTTLEDHELWTRIYGKVKYGLINKVLLDYRVHPKQTTKSEKFKKDLYKKLYKQTSRIYNRFNLNLNENLFLFFLSKDVSYIVDSKRTYFELGKLLNNHSIYMQKRCLICRVYLLMLLVKPLFLMEFNFIKTKPVIFLKLNVLILRYILGLTNHIE